MQKRAFIIHGWEGKPNEHWLPWLQHELEERGFHVEVPSMPNTDEPVIDEWVAELSRAVGELDQHTYFIRCPEDPACKRGDEGQLKSPGGAGTHRTKIPWYHGCKPVVIFIGHSIGCQAILRYLATQTGKKAGGCVFVAGWFRLENLEDEEVERIAEPWLRDDIDFDAVHSTITNFTVINSNSDDYGAVEENKKLLEQKLGANVVIMENMGHFTASDGVTELPAALKAVLRYAGMTTKI